MTTKHRGKGDIVDHVAASAISSGDVVVLGSTGKVTLGIAIDDIASGSTGPVMISEVHEVAKVSGAVIAQGESVNWDASASAFDDNAATAATGDVSDGAIAVAAYGSGVTTMQILLLPGNGTIT